jgi:creatinine amidohydrolase
MQRATEVFELERRRALVWWPRIDGGDPHAGHSETSLLLHLAPDRVDLGAATAGPVPSFPDLVRHGVRALSESGVLGDPTGATADDGRALFHELTAQLADTVDDWLAS